MSPPHPNAPGAVRFSTEPEVVSRVAAAGVRRLNANVTPPNTDPLGGEPNRARSAGATDHCEGRPQGLTVWFTGLSAAGKTTIARLVGQELEQRGYLVDYLDGDNVREHISAGLGFSREDREANIERVGWVASRLSRGGVVVLVSVIGPYEDARNRARAMVEEHAPFVEVHVATSLEECAHRDPKGLYARAFAGEIDHFTGVSDPYEEPSAPDLRLDTLGDDPATSVERVLARLEELGVIARV
jgi:adenylyl-sulfate kinase